MPAKSFPTHTMYLTCPVRWVSSICREGSLGQNDSRLTLRHVSQDDSEATVNPDLIRTDDRLFLLAWRSELSSLAMTHC
jgi:hypothetical protein